jgi:beta-phosphoglucomutase
VTSHAGLTRQTTLKDGMEHPDIRGFIFDMDGVLTDTMAFHYSAWKRLCDEEGIPFSEAISDRLRGRSREESLTFILNGHTPEPAAAAGWLARKNRYYLEYVKRITPGHCLPGVVRFLDEAQAAGLLLGVGSASKNARLVLEKTGLLDRFTAIGDGHSVGNGKPAPDLFVWVAARMGLAPSQAVVFEDGEVGVEAALAGGFWTVGLGATSGERAHAWFPGLDCLRVTDVLTRLRAAD